MPTPQMGVLRLRGVLLDPGFPEGREGGEGSSKSPRGVRCPGVGVVWASLPHISRAELNRTGGGCLWKALKTWKI